MNITLESNKKKHVSECALRMLSSSGAGGLVPAHLVQAPSQAGQDILGWPKMAKTFLGGRRKGAVLTYQAAPLVERMAEYGWKPHRVVLGSTKTYHGPQLAGICVKNGEVRFHRIRDFKQHYFQGIPPTSHFCKPRTKPAKTTKRITERPQLPAHEGRGKTPREL